MVNENATLDLTCTQCGHNFTKTVAEVDSPDEFRCPSCNVLIKWDGPNIEETVNEEVAKARRDMARAFRNDKNIRFS